VDTSGDLGLFWAEKSMFRGISKLTVDAKGRLAMPKHHRDLLESEGITRLMVTVDPSHCLLIYPMPDWLEIEEQLMSAPNADPRIRTMQRLFVGHASPVEFDVNGRILLPQALRDYAGIKKKAVMLGQGKKCELWSEESFESSAEMWPEEVGDVDLTSTPEAIQNLSF